MSYDGKLLRRAQARLEGRRERRMAQQEARREEIFRKVPRIKEIDNDLRQTILGVISAALREQTDPAAAVEGLQKENLALQKERGALLTEHGFDAQALDDTPLCPDCDDTGYQGAKVCHCLKELYAQEQIKELSKLLDLGQQSFETFSLSYYDTQIWPDKGISPRENMKLVYEICKGYGTRFGSYYFDNLFFSGPTGLGKTFLSACIAREVSQRGFSVVYDTATNIFAQFEAQKFSRDSQDGQVAKDETRRYLQCDLLIVDDLGAEMTTPFVQTALYMLINGRLVEGKRTAISSNLSMQEVRARYSPQIASRLEGEYRTLPFFGQDIRLMRKENSKKFT